MTQTRFPGPVRGERGKAEVRGALRTTLHATKRSLAAMNTEGSPSVWPARGFLDWTSASAALLLTDASGQTS